jgi:hypothetical protein
MSQIKEQNPEMDQVLAQMFIEQDALVAASNQDSGTKDVSSKLNGVDASPPEVKDFSLHDFSQNVVGNEGDSDMDIQDKRA